MPRRGGTGATLAAPSVPRARGPRWARAGRSAALEHDLADGGEVAAARGRRGQDPQRDDRGLHLAGQVEGLEATHVGQVLADGRLVVELPADRDESAVLGEPVGAVAVVDLVV